MRINETGYIQKQEAFLMGFGISARGMNHWFNEIREPMLNRVSRGYKSIGGDGTRWKT